MLFPTIKINDKKSDIKFNHTKYGNQVIQEIDFSEYLDKYLTMEYFVPLLDLQYVWSPSSDGVLFLKNEWDQGMKIRLNQSMPVFCLLNQRNESLFSIAVNELMNELEVTIGVHEESASVKIKIETMIPIEDYHLSLSLIENKAAWFEVVQQQVNWLYQVNEIKPKQSPQSSYEPVLSTWYSFHQSVDDESIVDEAKKYKKLGANTIILDDGWQTDDGNRRYAYAGDWEVSANKFPDFSNHVKKVQELDMNYLLWVSLPYLGNKSAKWHIFENDFLYYDEFQKAGILDIRKKNVQTYLLETIDMLQTKYVLNGLKIDFLETFFSESISSYEISLSLVSFFKALENQLGNESTFLIEFRQDYINPIMMQFCNIIRAKDCPNNYVLNRVRTIDLRLSCPYTAIHSDMVMWNKNEVIEDAALHLINTLFSVPQLSMKYDELSMKEIKMVEFWLSFMTKYQTVLLKSSFEPLYPQDGYSVVRSYDTDLSIVAVFGEDKLLNSSKHPKQIFVNATKVDKLVIRLPKGKYQTRTYDCLGDESIIDSLILLENQVVEFKVPKSGLLTIDME